MAYAVSTDDRHELIIVDYSGGVTIDSRIAAMNETLALLEQTGYRRILIDYTDALAQLESLAAQSAFASLIAGDPQLRQCRISFVGARHQQFNAVIEMLSEARHYRFKRCYDRDSAIAWLLSERTRYDAVG